MSNEELIMSNEELIMSDELWIMHNIGFSTSNSKFLT